jgi:two-component system chemotaxis response regulator CheB
MTQNNIFLLPGESAFVREPTAMSTLLGSCIAVCLNDTRNHWSGMNHYMLPNAGDGGLEDGKCGDRAIPALIRLATLAGSRIEDLVAGIYGGGRVVGHLGSITARGGFDIGDRNIAIAERLLSELRIPIKERHVGGENGRRIHMDSTTGVVTVKLIQSSEENQARSQKMEELRARKTRVLLVDDSATVRRLLRSAIEASDDLQVCGEADNPYAARERILECDPDVLCLDIIMPRMDGLTFLKRIMQFKPIPTIIVSTIAKEGSAMERNVREAGAVDVIDKERLEIYRGPEIVNRLLLPRLRAAAATVVAKRG